MHTKAWRQKLAGKGREIGSQTEERKAGRGKWATEAGRKVSRQRQAG
jgi:hypothetical protein